MSLVRRFLYTLTIMRVSVLWSRELFTNCFRDKLCNSIQRVLRFDQPEKYTATVLEVPVRTA